MDETSWRLIEDDLCDGGLNMATDLALLRSCEKGAAPPTLRLYGWKKPTLSIGHSQDAEREINLDLCREMGVPVVKRPTGGKAILHGNEITYAVIAPTAHHRFDCGIRGTLNVIGNALLAGLKELGVSNAVLNDGQNNFLEDRTMVSPACFASLNHFEILVGGRKLVGSAQKRTRRAFLQHGSVLIDFDARLFLSLLKFKGSAQLAKYTDALDNSVATLNKIREKKIGFAEATQALRKGFEKEFPGAWVVGGLAREEKALRDTLVCPSVW